MILSQILTYLLLEMNLPLQLIELDHAIAAYWREKGLVITSYSIHYTKLYEKACEYQEGVTIEFHSL